MKQKMKLVGFVAACMIIGCPFSVSAADAENEIVTYSSINYSQTVKDKDSPANRYGVTGASQKSGKTAIVSTHFVISYYGDGKPIADKYNKILTVDSNVSLWGGGANTISRKCNASGSSGECVAKDSYTYSVFAIDSKHTFSCNGGSGGGSSFFY